MNPPRPAPPVYKPVVQRVAAPPPYRPQPSQPAIRPVRAAPPGFHRIPPAPAIQRASLWSGLVNWLYPPPPTPAPQPPPPTEREILLENRRHFRETGRPQYRELKSEYPHAVDRGKWSQLTYVHGRASNLKKRARNTSPGAVHALISELLSNFVNYGFGYHIMSGMSLQLLDTHYGKDSPNGNCIAYAQAFANILNSFGIDAKAKWVRPEHGGRFIVKLAHFIDPSVTGHIFEKNVLKPGYYVFTSHAATWVPATQKYYDPMATISYASLDPYVECDLDSDKNEIVFTPSSPPKTLNPGYKWKLIRREKEMAGGFFRLDMVPLKKRKK